MYEFYIARRYLASRKGRLLSLISTIAVCGFAVGVAALIIATSILNGFHSELRRRILAATPHLVAQRFFGEPIEEYESLRSHLKSYPFITSVCPVVYAKTLIKSKRRADGIMVRGVVDTLFRKESEEEQWLIEGSFYLKEDGVVLGVDLARTLGVLVGDTVYIVSPFLEKSPLAIPRLRRLIVTGIFDLGHFEFNSSLAFVDIRVLQKLYKLGTGISGIEIRVDDPMKVERYSRLLEQNLEYPYHLNNWIEMNRNLFAALKLEKTVTFIVLTLIIIVASFNIIGTLIMLVSRKTREIGILKSIGAARTAIGRIFTYTGLLIGIIGTGIGLLLGITISILIGKYHFIRLPSDIYFISTVPVIIRPLDLVIIVVSALAISYLATIYPARRASSLLPVEAIRNE